MRLVQRLKDSEPNTCELAGAGCTGMECAEYSINGFTDPSTGQVVSSSNIRCCQPCHDYLVRAGLWHDYGQIIGKRQGV